MNRKQRRLFGSAVRKLYKISLRLADRRLRIVFLTLFIFRLGMSSQPVQAQEMVETARLQGKIANEAFGLDLAVGDFNGDGYGDLAVGSHHHIAADEVGKVEIFLGSSSGLASVRSEVLEGVVDDEDFGRYLAAGDLNGDGKDDLAIASINGRDNPVVGSGQVRVYFGGENGFTYIGSPINGSQADDEFGKGLVIGDITGDDIGDLVIGAPDMNYGVNLNVGMIKIYTGSTQNSLTPGNTLYGTDAQDFFGRSLAMGDIDDDGVKDILIGSVGHANAAGKIDFFNGGDNPGSTPLQSPVVGTEGNQESFSLVTGNFNGDEHTDFASSAILASTGGLSANGRVSIFSGNSGSFSPAPQLFVGEDGTDVLGVRMAVGDLDGDGIDDLVATEYYTTNPDLQEGSIRIFKGTSSVGLTELSPEIEGDAKFATLGFSLAMEDFNGDGYDEIAAGAPGISIEGNDVVGEVRFYAYDECTSDPAKLRPGTCGCGVPDEDTQGNGVLDCQDPNATTVPPEAKVKKKKKSQKVKLIMTEYPGVSYKSKIICNSSEGKLIKKKRSDTNKQSYKGLSGNCKIKYRVVLDGVKTLYSQIKKFKLPW